MERIQGRRSTRTGFVATALPCVALAATLLPGCASLPTSGPTVHQLVKQYRSGVSAVPFTIVPLDAAAVKSAPPAAEQGVAQLATLATTLAPARADMILPGDTLTIAVFEVGVGLFGGAAPAAGAAVPRTPSAAAQALTVEVREDGYISLPYVGLTKAAGIYPENLAALIRRRLKPLSENPEVTVSVTASVNNVVYLGGVVAKAGRYRLTAAREHLLDVLAIAGGSTVDPNEIEVRLQRGGLAVAAPLNAINPGDLADLAIHPGDRIQLVRVRRSFTVFGASDRVSQVFFEAKDLSLAEAIARAAGPSDYRANPRGVFVCRWETGPDDAPKPVVYQLNMMQADAYFLAQKYPMRDKDVILFANSSGTITQKLVGLLGSLFTPVATVRFAAQ